MDAIDLGATAIQLVRIPSGTFLMGSPNVLFSEAPVHEVTIGYEFYLGKYLLTQHQWEIVMDKNHSTPFHTSPEHPVDSVSWEEAIAFCQKLSDQCGARVQLPSEAEWEYACHAGTQGEFFFSTAGPFVDETSVPFEVRHGLQEYAWFEENSREETHPVGFKKPNPWGLFDIIGNLRKWCEDVWHSDYSGAPTDGPAIAARVSKLAGLCHRARRAVIDGLYCAADLVPTTAAPRRRAVAAVLGHAGGRAPVCAGYRPRWDAPDVSWSAVDDCRLGLWRRPLKASFLHGPQPRGPLPPRRRAEFVGPLLFGPAARVGGARWGLLFQRTRSSRPSGRGSEKLSQNTTPVLQAPKGDHAGIVLGFKVMNFPLTPSVRIG